MAATLKDLEGNRSSFDHPSSVILHPSSARSSCPFVDLTPVHDHLRNYAAEAQAELDAQTKRLKRIKGPRNTIEMLIVAGVWEVPKRRLMVAIEVFRKRTQNADIRICAL